jgi:small subunit ribosomal protein S7
MRRRRAPKREFKGDPKYNSQLVGHFINIVMLSGKKTVAQKIVYSAFDIVGKKMNEDPLKIFFNALENARPRMAVKPRRIGGATYQVPLEVPKEKGMSIALRWMKDFAVKKKGKPMPEKLADEIASAYKNEGGAVKKKEDTHRMAESNRAFAHFRY